MKSWSVLLLGVVLFGVPRGAAADGKDLAAAEAEFARWDKELNRVYAELKASLEEGAFRKLQDDQRAWVEYRDHLAEWEAEAQGKDPAQDGGYWEMAAGLTESRVEFLKAWKGVGRAGDWSGVYHDGYGGELRVVERDGVLHFTMMVVRGPTHHTGAIEGVAKVNGATGWFAVASDVDERATWLTMLNNRGGDGRIEVIGENTQAFHGARAYFDGRYLRVKLLVGEAADEVVAQAAQAEAP